MNSRSWSFRRNLFNKATVDLQGCLPKYTFFVRCFEENFSKLYISEAKKL